MIWHLGVRKLDRWKRDYPEFLIFPLGMSKSGPGFAMERVLTGRVLI
jgi:hypothetical protein